MAHSQNFGLCYQNVELVTFSLKETHLLPTIRKHWVAAIGSALSIINPIAAQELQASPMLRIKLRSALSLLIRIQIFSALKNLLTFCLTIVE